MKKTALKNFLALSFYLFITALILRSPIVLAQHENNEQVRPVNNGNASDTGLSGTISAFRYNLGWMYENGLGVEKSYGEAIKWYRLAAEDGFAEAEYSLGSSYANGTGVPQDYRKAVEWTRLAAEQGSAYAQHNLGVLYDAGRGVPQDHREAAKWYRLAAEQGLAEAQFNLGVLYLDGQGVPQDYREAVKWYRLAAEQGHALAQLNLGVRYVNGQGVAENIVAGYALFNVSAANDPTNAIAPKNRNAAAQSLSPTQLLTGQALSRELMKPGNFLNALDRHTRSR